MRVSFCDVIKDQWSQEISVSTSLLGKYNSHFLTVCTVQQINVRNDIKLRDELHSSISVMTVDAWSRACVGVFI